MTTIHLTDAQRDTFAACGLIVIDGERGLHSVSTPTSVSISDPVGDWRDLDQPCDTCHGLGHTCALPNGRICPVHPCPNPDCVGGRRVVTLTATCPDCGDSDDPGMVIWPTTGCLTRCDRCDGNPDGVVTLGRFTIPALLPVVDAHRMAPDVEPGGIVIEVADGDLWMMPKAQPLPRPGQFIAHPEAV